MKPIGKPRDAASFQWKLASSQSRHHSGIYVSPDSSAFRLSRAPRGMVARLEKYLSRACPGATPIAHQVSEGSHKQPSKGKLTMDKNQLSRGTHAGVLSKSTDNFSGSLLLAGAVLGVSLATCNQGRLHKPLTGTLRTAKSAR